MTPYFFKLVQENEKLYQAELLRYGVEQKLASEAAKILASEKPDELLSSEELSAIVEACEQWSTQYLYCNGSPFLRRCRFTSNSGLFYLLMSPIVRHSVLLLELGDLRLILLATWLSHRVL